MKSQIEKLLKDCTNMDVQVELDVFGDAETVRLAVSEFDRLKRVIHATREVRKAQILYHKTRLQGDLKSALAWEREVDKLLASLWDSKVVDAVQDTLL